MVWVGAKSPFLFQKKKIQIKQNKQKLWLTTDRMNSMGKTQRGKKSKINNMIRLI